MRVSSWEFHCSSLCSSKSSIQHCSPRPLKSEGVHLVSPRNSPASLVSEKDNYKSLDEKVGVEKKASGYGNVDCVLRSSLKKPVDSDLKENKKGSVRWMDLSGKDLVQGNLGF